MKSFLLGMAGGFLVLLVAAVLIPTYTDYSDRAITTDMLRDVRPVQEAIEKKLIGNHTARIQGAGGPVGRRLFIFG